jgi:very-short-patch-repair endonuclease
MNLNNLPVLRTFRKNLRNNLTPAEARLWSMLKGSQLQGRKFRRQHSFNGYILDFYCSSEKLAIELDGAGHFNEHAAERDYDRRLFLRYFGIRVLRFENKYVFEDPEMVLHRIQESFGWEKLDKGAWIKD